MIGTRPPAFALVFTVSFFLGIAARAQTPPPDSAFLELDIPARWNATVDGQDVGQVRRFESKDIKAGQYLERRVTFRGPGGEQLDRTVLLRSGWTVKVAPPQGERLETVLQLGHKSADNTRAAFSPDGRWLVTTAGNDKYAILWDARTGRQLRSFLGTDSDDALGHVDCVAFSRDGKKLLTGTASAEAMVWDPETGKRLRTLKSKGCISAVGFSPDDRSFLTASTNGHVEIWSANDYRQIHHFVWDGNPLTYALFSPDGKHVLGCSYDRTAALFEIATGKKVQAFRGQKESLHDVDMTSDGTLVVTASSDRTVVVWDAASGKPVHSRTLSKDSPWLARFDPEGKRVLTIEVQGNKRVACLWDARSGEILRTVPLDASTHAAAFNSRTGAFLAGRSIWNSMGQERLCALAQQGPVYFLSSLTVTHNQEVLISTSGDGEYLRWNAQRGLRTLKTTPHESGTLFARDGRSFLAEDKDNAVQLFDLDSGKLLQTFRGHTKQISAKALSPDGKRLLTGSQDLTARLWDVESGKTLHTLEGHKWFIHRVAFDPKGRWLLTSSVDSQVALWDATNGKPVRSFSGFEAAFDPQGERLAIAGGLKLPASATLPEYCVVRICNAADGKLLAECKGHGRTVDHLCFSPDGNWLLTGSTDATAMLWDAKTGKRLHVLRGHTEYLRGVAFGAGGRLIATISSDSTLRIWDAATGAELACVYILDRGREWIAMTPDGLFDGSPAARERVGWRIDDKLNVVPVDRFFQSFYRAGLLSALWRGERPGADFQIGTSKPPTLKLVSTPPARQAERKAALAVEAIDEGGGVGEVAVFLNGSRYNVGRRTELKGKALRIAFEIDLAPGRNTIEIQAATADGSCKTDKVPVVVECAAAARGVDLYVLAIGVSKYADPALDLKYAAGDAKSIAALFVERGKPLYRNIAAPRILTDENATLGNIRAAIKEIAAVARPEDVFLLFVAGHGTVVGTRYYFLPHEVNRSASNTVEEAIRNQGLASDVLASWLTDIAATKRVVAFDTCHAAAAIGVKRGGRDPFALEGAVESLRVAQGVHSIAASAVGEEAQEPDELGHGVLSYALLAGFQAVKGGPLEGKGIVPSNSDGVITVSEWFGYASNNMPRLTEKYFRTRQFPAVNNTDNIFPLLPAKSR